MRMLRSPKQRMPARTDVYFLPVQLLLLRLVFVSITTDSRSEWTLIRVYSY